ncbi:MAG TPA: hypothetical protein VFZ69_15020 [Longimicrobiales bacterium]
MRLFGSNTLLFTPGQPMQDVYLICLVIGAVVLLAQTLFGLLGVGHALPESIEELHAGEGLDLLSVRAISAGATLFGAVGLWLAARGLPLLVTLPAALIAGTGALIGTAYVTRQMLRLESDGTIRVDNALGLSGTVYLPVPARGGGHGVVQFTIQGRTVELRAISENDDVIPTGTAVIAVAVMPGDIVEVTPTPIIEGIDE